MKSSTSAVFTRQNPFKNPPPGKAHYNPSCTKKLPKQQRKPALSPVRQTQPSSPPPPQTHSLSPEDQRFIGAANHFVLCPPPLGPPPANTTPALKTNAQTEVTAGESLVAGTPADQRDSVLAKYVERFRHGRPQSREEREQTAAGVAERQQPFWWLTASPLPSSSTPTQTHKDFSTVTNERMAATLSPFGPSGRGTTLSPCGGLLDLSAGESQGVSDSFLRDLGDPEVLHLQERASRLLRRSEHSSSSGSIPISSEGLGCSDTSSPVSGNEPVRRPMIPSLIDSTTAVKHIISYPTSTAGPSANGTRPEDDILFQWRLRRKMEQASQPLSQYGPSTLSQYGPSTLSQYGPSTLSQYGPSTLSQYGPCSHQPPSVNWPGHKCVLPAEPSHRATPSFSPAPQETKAGPSPVSSPAPQETKAGPSPVSSPAPQETKAGPSPVSSPAPQETKAGPSPVSSPTVSKLQSEAPVSAHMHHLCPARPSPPPPRRQGPQRWEVSGPQLAPRRPPAPPSSTNTTEEEECTSKHQSSPPPASPETTEEEWIVPQRRAEGKTKGTSQRRQAEQTEKLPGPSCRKKTTSVRHHGGDGDRADGSSAAVRHSRGPQGASPRREEASPWREEASPWREEASPRREEASRDAGQQKRVQGRPGHGAPPPSPIHSALGQVISGVLFPSPPRTPVSSDSPRCTPPAPPQSPAPPADVRQPTEVISQLLQEAIDSDETEFEDDPLLQVLRKQRKWLKEQMREVDSLLEEFQQE